MTNEEFKKAYAKIVAKAWADDAFKQRLLSHPNTVLKENGVDVPGGVQFTVIETTSNSVPLILPPKPALLEEKGPDDLERRLAATNCYMGMY